MQTMKYEWRSAVGVLIGCINIVGFSATSVYIIKVLCDFGKLSDNDTERNQDVISKTVTLLYIILVVCVISVFLSGLLIAGIIKKRHLLMRPWLICASVGIVCHTFRLMVGSLSGFLSGALISDVVVALLKDLMALAIQILIFYFIYKLYLIIRDMGNGVQTEVEHEETVANANDDNPPSYEDLERGGQLRK